MIFNYYIIQMYGQSRNLIMTIIIMKRGGESSPVSVNDGIESETVSPGLSKVLDTDAWIFVSCLLSPSQ